MRLSADRDDPGHEAYLRLISQRQWVTAYLDGKPLDHVITADDAEGWVVRYRTDADGQFVLEGEGEGVSIARETLTGRVVIEWTDRPA